MKLWKTGNQPTNQQTDRVQRKVTLPKILIIKEHKPEQESQLHKSIHSSFDTFGNIRMLLRQFEARVVRVSVCLIVCVCVC